MRNTIILYSVESAGIFLHYAKEKLVKLVYFFDWQIQSHFGIMLAHDSWY